jgi:ribosomal protein S3AE
MAEDNKQAAKNAAKAAADLKKQKKKKWFPIVAPEAFQGKIIGEILLDDSSQLMNRPVKVNMMQLMGDMKKQNVNILFKVTDVKDGKGYAQAVKYEISPFSLKRLAKREKDKLSDSFVVKTAEGKLVRVKSVMVTNAMTNGAVLAALVKTCRAVCKELVNKIKFEQLIIDLVTYKFQKEVKESLHKVYPLRNFDIRLLEIENKKKKETVEEEMLMKLQRDKEKKLAEKAEEQEHEDRSQDKTDDVEESQEFDNTEGEETPEEETDDEDSESESEGEEQN